MGTDGVFDVAMSDIAPCVLPALAVLRLSMLMDVLETLARLGADSANAVYLQAAATETAIESLQSDARRDLGEAVPQSYVRLLRLTNGVQINGAYFKKAEHLVLENLDVPRPETIVLGNSGNVVEYVFDRRDRGFHIINMGYPDEQLESFATFEELLQRVFEEQQVL
jgi:hypothetical protein